MEKYTNKKRNVFKRAFSTYKKRRFNRVPIFKNPRYQECMCRGEYMDTVYVPGLGNTYLHQNNGFQYFNFYSMLSLGTSISGFLSEFDMYMIKAVSAEVMPCNDSYAVTFSYGAPAISIGINPTETSATLGNTAFTNDTSVICYLNQKSPSRKYISFPANYFNGTTLGIGTWNRCDNSNSQVGEWCTYMPDTNTNLSGSQTYLYTVKYVMYVLFKQRTK